MVVEVNLEELVDLVEWLEAWEEPLEELLET